MESGLYRVLVDADLLIPHEEADIGCSISEDAYKVIAPEPVPFISYPYEWCFSQLKDAALATLEIQKRSLELGMSLKDCSAYNIQFFKGKALLIDTLSFESYSEGEPWVAYRQFCQHFLGPLALMSYVDIRLNQLLRVYIDGVPLDLSSKLLPARTRAKLSLQSHIHMHAKYQKRYADKGVGKKKKRGVSRLALLGIIDSLESSVKALKWRPRGTEWGEYYDDTNYSSESFEQKKELVSRLLDKTKAMSVWDLGANTGLFSRIASGKGMEVISFDIDPACVEKNYLECVKEGEANIIPLIMDLTNPSSSIGWANEERMSFLERGPVDTVLALALIHHLAISNNLPLGKVAGFFGKICRSLIIEFVPKEDSQVKRLLSTREDIFPNYTREGFERAFGEYFVIDEAVNTAETERTMYLMLRKDA
jgi:2-polyprenyl-3-methyl-5-hydroxy-6-metoxy-1,4-benzoquinol methylase